MRSTDTLDTLFFDMATDSSLRILKDLLKSENLCWDDLDEIHGVIFILKNPSGDFLGGYALEIYPPDALLRSVVVDKRHRKSGLGVQIIAHALDVAGHNNLKTLYLLTTTADKFFAKLGFRVLERSKVPGKIASTKEFKTFCPDSAICMTQDIADG